VPRFVALLDSFLGFGSEKRLRTPLPVALDLLCRYRLHLEELREYRVKLFLIDTHALHCFLPRHTRMVA
jgi:hypothetical protein